LTVDVTAKLTAALSDRYRVERELGAGGMATVYLARDLRHDRDVAIKVLHPELAAALGGERFLSEIKTTARLQHPHILPLLDSGDAGGFLYYVMPYLTGETLRARLERERQLPIEDALRIAREVADALGSAHALGIIHRDIKPENILLQGGHALVADFGIALAVQSASGARMTQTGLSLGTPQYMSPEQAMGEKTIDMRSDLYALGAVTYEMLVGEPPFTGPSVQAIVARVMTEQPRGISLQRKSVTPAVEIAVMRALEKLPADRYATAGEFVAALGANVSAARVSPTVTARRRGYIVAALSAAAICLAGGWILGRRSSGALAATAMSTSIVLPDSLALQPLATNTEGMATIALSPDGSRLAFIARKGQNPQLFIRRMSDFGIQAIDGTEGALAPFFTPKGDAVAFFAAFTLKLVTLADGRVTTVAQNVIDAWGGAFTTDGRIVLARNRASVLAVLSPSGDSLRTITCVSACSFPEVLPDDRHVIVTTRAGLDVIDVETGIERPLLRWEAKAPQDRVRGMSARYDAKGYLVYVTPGGQVLAAPFDARRAVISGPPVVLAEGVRVETGRGAAQFALSAAGVVAYAPGPVMSVGILVRADRNGKLDTIPAPPANYNSLELTPDGRRVVARVGTASGDESLQIVDVESGKVTPWLSGPSLGRPAWAEDGRKVYFGKDGEFFVADPELSASPERVPATLRLEDMMPLADGKGYRGWRGDTIVIVHADGSSPMRIVAKQALAATSADGRWSVAEEPQTTETAVVARSLDGGGRRIVLAGGGRFAMAVWAAGGHEFIVADAQRVRDRTNTDQTVQGFWAVSYDPSKPDHPFGEPHQLFRAVVADFPGRNYAVGMDGNRFVFKEHLITPPPREVRIITGWHAALARLASGNARER
jgi:serine/threonine-protein kinase